MEKERYANSYQLTLKGRGDDEALSFKLESLGVQILYLEEKVDGVKELYCTVNNPSLLDKIKSFEEVETIEKAFLNIDWEEQSSLHSQFYCDGKVEFPVEGAAKERWKKVWMLPGGGFGDLSHPTTTLVIDLIGQRVGKKRVIDIGCGNGVLSLVAVAKGATSVAAVDIDREALDHAQKNILLNGMEEKITLIESLSDQAFSCSIALMNMISSEQNRAWKEVRAHLVDCREVITSGVLIEQREEYLEWSREQGWRLIEEREREGWLGFYFEII